MDNHGDIMVYILYIGIYVRVHHLYNQQCIYLYIDRYSVVCTDVDRHSQSPMKTSGYFITNKKWILSSNQTYYIVAIGNPPFIDVFYH